MTKYEGRRRFARIINWLQDNGYEEIYQEYDKWETEEYLREIQEKIDSLTKETKNMIGFYAENYEGNEIKSKAYPSFDSLESKFNKANYDKDLMIQYIESLPIHVAYRGRNTCNYILNNNPEEEAYNRGVYYTDGEFSINSITINHIQLYDIELPKRFVDRAIKGNYNPVLAMAIHLDGDSKELENFLSMLVMGIHNRQNMEFINEVLNKMRELKKYE